MSLDAKEAGDLFRFPASFVLVINIQNAFDLTQMGFWDCICRVKSQDDFTSTVIIGIDFSTASASFATFAFNSRSILLSARI